MTARGMMRLLVVAACLCTGTRRVTAQLTEDTPIGARGGAGSAWARTASSTPARTGRSSRTAAAAAGWVVKE
ncbi:MAG: hypothetical protein ACPIOQ_54805 [Promethearchaeia archaeon]